MYGFNEQTTRDMDEFERIKYLKRVQDRRERIAMEKRDKHRNYLIGELASKYFPELLRFEPGTKAHNAVVFAPVETFMSVLAADNGAYRVNGCVKKRLSTRPEEVERLESLEITKTVKSKPDTETEAIKAEAIRVDVEIREQ